MVKPMSLDDFRAIRHVFEPDDFALTDGKPEPPPSDLISEETWHHLVGLPDDVSIRTSNHHGTEIGILGYLGVGWVESIGGSQDLVGSAMVEVMMDFDASIYNLLVGYYPLAIGCLRGILEGMMAGAYCQLGGKSNEFKEWVEGQREIPFGMARGALHVALATQPLNQHLSSMMKDSIFDQKRGQYPGGWAQRLYNQLCRFSHARPMHNNAGMWQSNGPIYVPTAVLLTTSLFIQTVLLGFFLVKLCRPTYELPPEVRTLVETDVLSLPRELQVPGISRRIYRYLFNGTLRLTL